MTSSACRDGCSRRTRQLQGAPPRPRSLLSWTNRSSPDSRRPDAWMRAVSASPLPFMDAGAAAASDREPPDACSSSTASAAVAQHARSLLHECRRRLPGARRRRRIADRVCDPRQRRRGLPGRGRRGSLTARPRPENPPRYAARNSTRGFKIGRISGTGHLGPVRGHAWTTTPARVVSARDSAALCRSRRRGCRAPRRRGRAGLARGRRPRRTRPRSMRPGRR